jgi:hypothetical protein
MAKKILIGMFVMFLAFSFPGLSLASILVGKVVKIEGSVCVIKDDLSGKEYQLRIDQSTIKQGEIKEGVHVEVEVDDKSGNAKSIKVKET